MKTIFLTRSLAFLFTLCLTALFTDCSEKEKGAPAPLPAEQSKVKISKISRTNQDRLFIYNGAGNLTEIKTVNKFNSGVTLSSSQHISYNSAGKVDRVTLQEDGYKIETRYLYENGKVVKTEEYFNDHLSSYVYYTYNPHGKLISSLTFQTDDFNQFREYWKHTYTYHENGNLHVQTTYLKGPASDWALFQTFRYEDYDNRPNFEYLTAHPVLPEVITQQNNPGRLIHTNGHGVAATSTYAYEYNSDQYPVKKTVSSPKNNFTIEYSYIQ